MMDDNEGTSRKEREITDQTASSLTEENYSNEDDTNNTDTLKKSSRQDTATSEKAKSRNPAGSDIIKLQKKPSALAEKPTSSSSITRDIKQLSQESQRLHLSRSVDDDIDEAEFLDILFFVDSESKVLRSSSYDLNYLTGPRFRVKDEFRARRTEVDDVQYIDMLTGPFTYLLFGRVNLYDLIEKAILAVTLEQTGSGVVAHAAFSDSPTIQSVSAAEWEQWLQSYVGKDEYVYTPLNTIFLQYFVADEMLEAQCLGKLMHAAFSTLIYVKYIILVVPERIKPGSSLCSVFQILSSDPLNEVSQQYSLMICKREKLMPGLNIRIARVEDSDDLVELFDKLAIVLKQCYGEYFIAELIEHQDQLDKCLVAETKQGIPVGFMSLSRNVDAKLLNHFFDLTPFCHLKKLYRKPEVVEVKIEPVKVTKSRRKGKKGAAEEESEEKEPKEEESDKNKLMEEPAKPSVDTRSSEAGLVEEFDFNSCFDLQDLMTQSQKLKRSTQLVSEHPLSPKASKEDIQENAFCIHLFVVSNEYQYGFVPLLEEAFRLHPDLEWSVVSGASWSNSSPLFQLFTRVSPKPKIMFPEDLYVCHRWGLIKAVKVRPGLLEDAEKLQEFVKSVTGSSGLVEEFRKFCFHQRSKDLSFSQVFLLECRDNLIGCGIVSQEESIEYFRSHFNIEEYIYFGLHRREDHAVLSQFLINPIFSHYTRFFLKYETKTTCLTAIEEFIPVTCRKILTYDVQLLEENVPSMRCTGPSPPKFTLALLSKKYVMEHKIPIRARVVVVGASATALWLLKNFLESPSLKFLNICLVSTHGLEELCYHAIFEVLHQGRLLGPMRYVNPLLIKTWVSTSSSKMKVIYREQKFIELEDKSEIPYDYLVLCCGKQYYVPSSILSSIPEEIRQKRIFLMNNDEDCVRLLQWLQDNTFESNECVVVYGNNLKAYSLVAGLLLLGLSGHQIKMVEPRTRKEDFCLEDPTINGTFRFLLEEVGVKLHSDYSLINVTEEKASFSSPDPKRANLTFNSKMLFYFADKNVDYGTFLAMNNASLVYDGGLVINHEFRTNDPWILAAGPITKFSRCFYTPLMAPVLKLSSEKAGELLAARLREILDPTFDSKNHQLCSNATELIAALQTATPEVSWLPGNKCFFHVCRSSNCAGKKKHSMKELVTGCIEENQYPYVKISINSFKNVEALTCFHDQRIDFNIFLRIFNINEAFLNHLITRYDAGEVKDLYSYFTDPWSYALLHDRFREYWDEARKLICRKVRANSMLSGLLYRISLLPPNEVQLNEYYRKEFEKLMTECEVTKEIEAVLLSFLQYNQSLLPMYALPDQIHGRTEEL